MFFRCLQLFSVIGECNFADHMHGLILTIYHINSWIFTRKFYLFPVYIFTFIVLVMFRFVLFFQPSNILRTMAKRTIERSKKFNEQTRKDKSRHQDKLQWKLFINLINSNMSNREWHNRWRYLLKSWEQWMILVFSEWH